MLKRLLVIGYLVLVIAACSDAPNISQRVVTNAEQLVLAEQHGQLVLHWPEQRSQRQVLNNKRRFLAYAGQGELLIDLQQVEKLRLRLNGQELVIHKREGQQALHIDISRLTRNGENRLELVSLSPADAKVQINIPYPTLRRDLTANTRRFAAVDQLIEQEIADGFPGAVLLVVKNGVIIKHSAYGYAERYQSDGSPLNLPRVMQTDTLFDIASNTKMYATNYALMRLVSEGKLDVTRPLQQYLPEYQGDGREQRTVSDLLYHTAGYAPEVHFFRPDNRHGPQFYSLNKADTEQLILTQVPFATERGTAAVYSDVDYMLLGMLIERLTGQPLDQYLREQFYLPLGLSHTLFNPLQHGFSREQIAATELDGNSRGGRVSFPANRRGVIVGEVHDEKAFYSFQGVAGHAGLFSTAAELAQLMAIALHGGGYGWQQFFNPATQAQFVAPSPYDHRFGLGWRTAVQGDLNWHFGAYASDSAFGHTGWTGTATVIDPERQLLVVLLTNKKHSPIINDGDSYYFSGDRFETGRYGSILTLIYQSLAI